MIARPLTSSSAVAALKRMQPVASDHRGSSGAELGGWIDAGTRPSHRVTGGALWQWVVSRGEGALTAVMCQSAAAGSSFNYDS